LGDRILWLSPSPYLNTGFGRASRQMLQGLYDKGFDVALLDLQWMAYPRRMLKQELGFEARIYPANRMEYILRAVEEFKPHALIAFGSIWVEPYRSLAKLMRDKYQSIKVAYYAPIEYITMSEFFMDILVGAHMAIFPSRIAVKLFGHHINPEHLAYVPHGVDPKVFRRLKPEEMVDARDPDPSSFKFLFVARNNLRKEHAVLMLAYRLLPSKLRRESMLMLFTPLQEMTPSANGFVPGWDIVRIARKYGVADRVISYNLLAYPEWNLPDEELNKIYNLADVYVHPSSGEGFGIPIVEAMAAERPVIATANSAMLEICDYGKYCLMAEPQGIMESWEGYMYTPTDPYDLSLKMEQMMLDSRLRSELASRARQRALEYTWDKAKKMMVETVEKLMGMEERITSYDPVMRPEDFELVPAYKKYAERMRR
jgi:glycosyltransferase involved in cell wall biosynthesis